MDYLNMKIADVTVKWIRQNFDIRAEQKTTTKVVYVPMYIFDMDFELPIDEFINKMYESDKRAREEHACLNRLSEENITTKIQHRVYVQRDDDDYYGSEESHSITMIFEYQELETQQETVQRLAEEVKKNIRKAKANEKAKERKATLKQKKAELKKLEIQNEFELYQKLKKKFEK